MTTIHDKEEQLVNEFSSFEDWMDKYNHLIELGKSLPVIDERYKTDQYMISGCQSKVWLHARLEGGRVMFSADSDAIITRGIISMLVGVLSGEMPDDILEAKMDFVDRIGLKEHLSPTRSNGLNAMIRQMKLYAMAFKARLSQPDKPE
jgi:cysteine desulfuration protein SufE